MWDKRKFLSLSRKTQHKNAAELIKESLVNKSVFTSYQRLEQWLQLYPLKQTDTKKLCDRYHSHLKEAELCCKEHNLLPKIQKNDSFSKEPFLPIVIYLDNLRSAYNVGSIIRTTEALRLGSVCFSSSTPFVDNPKVQKTSMQTYDKVSCKKITDLSELPRPFIALETAEDAPSVFEFDFPKSFTLLLGNEEYGLSDLTLAQADYFVKIPLFGIKNSLNVASAFAIAGSCIRKN